MKYLLIRLIRFYQRVLSPLKRRPTCRFVPTCSSYAITALQTRGVVIGLLLTVGRIARCQPFCAGGWDPVPERGLRRPRSIGKPMTKYYYPDEYRLEQER